MLSLQLLVTSFFVCLTFFQSVADFFKNSPALLWTCVGIEIVLGISLICFKSLARTVPTNYILLSIWTLAMSWIVAFIAAFYDPTTVVIAACLTAAVTISLTIYACTTKTDFTYCGGLLFVGSCLMLFMGLFFLIFGISPSNNFHPLNILYCGFGVLLYSIYLIYDTQLVMGKFGLEYSIDDYILAAMMIYIDIIEIFLYILRLLGSRR